MAIKLIIIKRKKDSFILVPNYEFIIFHHSSSVDVKVKMYNDSVILNSTLIDDGVSD